MKIKIIFLIILLGSFLVHAEEDPLKPIGIGIPMEFYQKPLSCIKSSCINCPEYESLFPIEEFSKNIGSLDIEADESEIVNEKYLLSGNVEVNSESLFLSSDNVEVSTVNNSLQANGNVKFQDESYLITSDLLSATRDKEGELIATATNANYQDYGAGIGGANGYTDIISKTPTSVVLTNSTYSLCPVNENDWLIDADKIELNLVKNRGVADNAIVKFYGVPIFYLPKYSWVLSGRGSGFLTPHYSSYTDESTLPDASGKKEKSYSIRVPYYINLAPDRDLLVALTYMSSRRFIYEGKYRQLIAPKLSPKHGDSIWSIEAKYLPEDKVTNLKRWLVNFSEEMDITDKTHLSANYSRVSDPKYFEEIDRSNMDVKTLKSQIKLSYDDEENSLTAVLLTEDEQIVNNGTPVYTRALEGSITKTLYADTNMPIKVGIVSTKFAHDTKSKTAGVRTHGDLDISRQLNIEYPKVTPSANIAITNYSLKNNPNINRTVLGSGLDVDFTVNIPTSIFNYKVNHRISPLISYTYRGKKVQGNIPIFDTTDKYDDIITFADLTSGERYTGLDRITNANDITLSLESAYSLKDAEGVDKDLLSLKVAQSFFTDDEVVSDSAGTNYETRKSYSDIAASIDIAVGKYVFGSAAQFNPDTSKIVKKENRLTYTSNSRKFITLSASDEGTKQTRRLYGAYPLTDSIHLFGGLDKITSTGITTSEASGIAYESCCWAFRIAHFKLDNDSNGYNYSTSAELILTGLGSTSSPLNGRIESYVPGYVANLK